MKSSLLSLALAGLIAPCHAQTAPCFAQNDQTNSVSTSTTPFGFAGPGMRAYQITSAVPVVTNGARIYTGNTSGTGFMTLEIWSNDTVNNVPAQRLAGGTWKISGPLGIEWQGANFDTLTVLLPNTPYWIVWIEPGFCTIPTDPTGTPGPAVVRSGTNWNALAPAALKLRLYCAPLDGQGVVSVGTPCASTGGLIGSTFTNQPPSVGNAEFGIEGSGFPATATSVLVLGLVPNFTSVQLPGAATGCLVHTDPMLTVVGVTGAGNQRAAAAFGHVHYPLPLPAFPAAAGFFFSTQLAVLDAASTASLPLVTTNGLRFTLF